VPRLILRNRHAGTLLRCSVACLDHVRAMVIYKEGAERPSNISIYDGTDRLGICLGALELRSWVLTVPFTRTVRAGQRSDCGVRFAVALQSAEKEENENTHSYFHVSFEHMSHHSFFH
jgi:hypothetical protein